MIFSLLFLAFSSFQIAEAKRFGGGSSHGYSRSAAPAKNTNSTAASQTQKKGGFGMLGGILAALGLGALFAWLFSAQGMTGLIIVLLILAALVFMFRRSKLAQQMQQNHMNSQQTSAQNTQQESHQSQSAFTQHANTLEATAAENTSVGVQDGKLPDGTPESVFNHQALNLFNQLQSLNTQSGLEKIKGYLTEDLYVSVKDDINENTDIAEFKDLNSKVISCEKQGDSWVASVMFIGQVKEDHASNWESFEEVWHFTRKDQEHLWQVAGIQQF